MDALVGLFLLFVVVCIFCAIWVGAIIFVIGTLWLMIKLIIGMAWLGACFIILGLIGLILGKVFCR